MAAEDRPPDGEMAVETFGPGRRGRRSPRCQVEHVTRGDPDERHHHPKFPASPAPEREQTNDAHRPCPRLG